MIRRDTEATAAYGRPADSQRLIVEALRGQIVAGTLAPGHRLPTRLELERHFGAGATTVQRALERLSRDGFVESRGRNGTFVVENPPHLTRYAVVFFFSTPEIIHNRFAAALGSEVRRLRAERPEVHIAEYSGVDGHEDSEDYQRLVREVRAHRIAGIIFTSHLWPVKGTPLLEEPSIPRVAIMAPAESRGLPVVHLDMVSFFERALDEVRERGLRKVAFLNAPGVFDDRAVVDQLLAERGLETRPYWWQSIAPNYAETAEQATHLLMECRERPEALIISNDNLLEYATAGLVAAGTRVPQELFVLSHCNFPYPTPSALPVCRLGFDARRVLQSCIESIDAQRNGEAVPAENLIEAIFEKQLQPRLVHGRGRSSASTRRSP